MRAGLLRDRIDVQRPVESPAGGPAAWETEHVGVPAEVEHLSGRELFEARSVVDRVSVRVRIRYLDGLTAEHRFLNGSEVLNIVAVLPDARRTRMEVLCEGVRG